MIRRGPWRGVVVGVVVAAAVAVAGPRAVAQEDEAEADRPIEQAGEPAGTWQGGEPAPAPGGASAEPISGSEPDYLLGPADLVQVRVWRNPELAVEVPVRPDGRISVPLVGDIEAAGLTTIELRDRIATGLAEYIAAPDVTVIVREVNSKIVFLVGELVRPTALPLTRDMRVLDAISVAGGFSPFANRRKIRILRPLPDGSVEQHKFNYNRVVKGKDAESNFLLRSGDTIVVPD
jgi:polysaccharide export outer membrane protein